MMGTRGSLVLGGPIEDVWGIRGGGWAGRSGKGSAELALHSMTTRHYASTHITTYHKSSDTSGVSRSGFHFFSTRSNYKHLRCERISRMYAITQKESTTPAQCIKRPPNAI